MAESKRCPRCGHQYSIKRNKEISVLLQQRSKSTRVGLTRMMRKMQSAIPSSRVDTNSVKKFLNTIEHCSDDVVEWCIDQYYIENRMYQGKGFAYLQAMILNHKLNREEMTNNQELMHGKVPGAEVLTTYDEWEKEILKLEKGENDE